MRHPLQTITIFAKNSNQNKYHILNTLYFITLKFTNC